MHATVATILTRQIQAGRQQLKALSDSPALRSPVSYFDQRRKNVELLKNRLLASQTQIVERKKRSYVEQTARLDAMSPLKVLTRGYAMAQTQDGSVLKSVTQVELGERIDVTFSDGKLSATVMEKKERQQ